MTSNAPDPRGRARHTPSASPAAPGPSHLPPADRPSIKVATAAAMLRRGHDPIRVAELTKVPLALVELLAEHATGDRPSAERGWHYVAPSRPWATPEPPTRGPHWWPLRAIVPMLTNLALVVDAVACNRPVLAAGCLIATVPLLVIATLLPGRR